MLRENRATVICGLMVALLLGALALWASRARQAEGAMVALVHYGDGEVLELPLDTDATRTIQTERGRNTVEVRDGAVRMADADCPNGSCLQATPLSEPGRQIICLPHQLWIEVVAAGSEGGEMDVTLAGDENVDLMAR